MLIYFIAIYLLVTFILALLGIDSKAEGVKVFIISLLLTPLAGIFFVLKNRRKASTIHYYYCHECDYIFPVKMNHCPMCQEEGKKVKLTKYQTPYQVTSHISPLDLA